MGTRSVCLFLALATAAGCERAPAVDVPAEPSVHTQTAVPAPNMEVESDEQRESDPVVEAEAAEAIASVDRAAAVAGEALNKEAIRKTLDAEAQALESQSPKEVDAQAKP